MAPMTLHLFSELDSRTFLGECTGAFGVVYGNSPAFCLAHGSSAVTWALPDPVLTSVRWFSCLSTCSACSTSARSNTSLGLRHTQSSVEFGDDQVVQDRLVTLVLTYDGALLADRGGQLPLRRARLLHGCPEFVRHGFMSEGLVAVV